MRRLILPLMIAYLLAMGAPAQAGGGLPKLTTLQVGHRTVAIHGDSAVARTGANVLTMEITEWTDGSEVSLTLVGPTGQKIAVPLLPVRVIEGPADAHGGGGAEQGATAGHDAQPAATHDAAPANAHGSASTDHGAMNMSGSKATDHSATQTPEPAADDHGTASGTYTVRGKASLPTAGPWQVMVAITQAGEAPESAEAMLDAEYGGPHPLYLTGAGALMGGSVLYGVIQKRRIPINGRS